MTKIRCQVCGSEELHSEGPVLVVCDRCGNRSYVIPEVAVVRTGETENGELFLRYKKEMTDCPRKSFCLNDTMFQGGEPCRICKVLKYRYETFTRGMAENFEKRQELLEKHPELAAEYAEEKALADKACEYIQAAGAPAGEAHVRVKLNIEGVENC